MARARRTDGGGRQAAGSWPREGHWYRPLDHCPTTVEDHAVIEQYSYCQLFQPPARTLRDC
jgi:hypothetical protein